MNPLSLDEIEQITSYLDVATPVPAHADLIFVFGTRLPDPAHIAAGLYDRGIAPYVVVTGGDNRETGVNEARAHHAILIEAGVPQDRIILEDRSTNTLENVTFALPEMARCIDLHTLETVLVIAKWMHSRRAVMTLKRHLPKGVCYAVHTYEPWDITRRNWPHDADAKRRVLKNWRNIPRYLELDHLAQIEREGDFYV